ncbi:MAG: 4'-phosphopantetheinyl transferase superfamily protein [Prevotella sp.]|nr:4'-phosphopantetheinyl transferase superfamily protein [Prevotella sp.]
MIYINDRLYDFDLETALASISAQRREQALRFKHEQGRRECVAAYLLLKEGLQKEYGIVDNPIFEYEKGGKPRIINHPDIYFNISHCREAAICVIDNVPIGVDIERIRPFKESLARHVLSDDEFQLVVSSPTPEIEFTKLWTQKEAVLKLTGEGIRSDLKDVLSRHAAEVILNTCVCDRYIYTVCRYSATNH